MIRNKLTELPPNAASLVREMVEHINSLENAVSSLKNNSVLDGKLSAVEGTQARTEKRILEQTYVRDAIDDKDAAVLAAALDAIPDAPEVPTLPNEWTNDVNADRVEANRVYAKTITEITGTRVSTWTDVATGLLGTASSSRKHKDHIKPLDLDAAAILSIEPKWYSYKAELKKRDDPTYDDYKGKDYKVAVEPGMIAEDLHDAGLGAFVIYDEDGEPNGIHYVMWVVALQEVARVQAAQIADLTNRLDALEKKQK